MGKEHTVEQYLKLRNISSVSIDRSGDNIVLEVSNTFHEKKHPTESAVVVFSAEDRKQIHEFRETNVRKHSPVFNHDGSRIAYLEKSSDKHYLVIFNLMENISEKLELDGEPSQIQWNGDSILILKNEPLDPALKKSHEDGLDGTFFEEEDPYASLYQYIPGSGFRKLTEKLQVWEFHSVGNLAVLIASNRPQEASWFSSGLYSLDIEGKQVKELYDPKYRTLARPRVSPDGSSVLVAESLRSDRGLTYGDIIRYDLKTGRSKNLTQGAARSFSDMVWLDGSKFATLWLQEGTFGISEYDGKFKDIWQAEGSVLSAFEPAFSYSSGKYAFGFTDAGNPPELYGMGHDGKPEKLSSFNSSMSELESYPAEVFRWKAEDGMEIHGILRSLGPDSPLVVYVHGGPTSASTISFLDRSTVFLGAGFSVFAPNYRGSTGAGREYAEANRGDMGGMDFKDIMSGLEQLMETGKLRSKYVFITGGSYGGFMTSWAVTQTSTFTAAAGLFGITDWLSFHGTSNIPDWDQIHYDDDPYNGELYARFSPIKYVSKVETPILLLHGINDPCVPVSQYHQFYRTLKDLGKTARLLLFPREGHGFSEKKHIEQSIGETISWFRKYLDQ